MEEEQRILDHQLDIKLDEMLQAGQKSKKGKKRYFFLKMLNAYLLLMSFKFLYLVCFHKSSKKLAWGEPLIWSSKWEADGQKVKLGDKVA